MYKITAVCDKCKKEETQECKGLYPSFSKEQTGWKEVKLEIPGAYTYRTFLFCSDCANGLGLIVENNKVANVDTVADNLVNLITDIVQQAMEDYS